MYKKALEMGNSLHKGAPLGKLEGVRLAGLLKGTRRRALETEHLLVS